MFGLNKKTIPPSEKREYGFVCPHCHKLNRQKFGTSYNFKSLICQHCGKPLIRIYHPGVHKVCVFQLFECEEIKESVGD